LRDIRKGALMTGSISFLKCSAAPVPSDPMDDKLTPADPRDVETALGACLDQRQGAGADAVGRNHEQNRRGDTCRATEGVGLRRHA
jgi:hypothetical protein